MWFEYMGNKKISFPLHKKKKKKDLLYITNITGLFIFLDTVEMKSLLCTLINFLIYVNAY